MVATFHQIGTTFPTCASLNSGAGTDPLLKPGHKTGLLLWDASPFAAWPERAHHAVIAGRARARMVAVTLTNSLQILPTS